MKTRAAQCKLSIVTVNLNNRGGLQKTIDSVIAQTCKDFEWVVIDGGSTDGSAELIEESARHFSYWVSEPDDGIFDAMNKGIQNSSGEYLLFLNSGDYLSDRNVVNNVIPFLKGNDFYVGRELREDEDYIWDLNLSTNKDICLNVVSLFIPHQSTFMRRSVFDIYGLYRTDFRYSSDWYMFYKTLILGNATVSRIPIMVSVFEGNGVSSAENERCKEEQKQAMDETPRMAFLYDFFRDNYDFVAAIRKTKWSFLLFRIYYFIYRKWLKNR